MGTSSQTLGLKTRISCLPRPSWCDVSSISLESESFTQVRAATLLGIDQPKVSDLLRDKHTMLDRARNLGTRTFVSASSA